MKIPRGVLCHDEKIFRNRVRPGRMAQVSGLDTASRGIY